MGRLTQTQRERRRAMAQRILDGASRRGSQQPCVPALSTTLKAGAFNKVDNAGLNLENLAPQARNRDSKRARVRAVSTNLKVSTPDSGLSDSNLSGVNVRTPGPMILSTRYDKKPLLPGTVRNLNTSGRAGAREMAREIMAESSNADYSARNNFDDGAVAGAVSLPGFDTVAVIAPRKKAPLPRGRGAATKPPLVLSKIDAILREARGYVPTVSFYRLMIERYCSDPAPVDPEALVTEAVKMVGWITAHETRRCSTAFILTWLSRAKLPRVQYSRKPRYIIGETRRFAGGEL